MSKILPAPVRGAITLLTMSLNTVFWTTPLLGLSFAKLALPVKAWRRGLSRLGDKLATAWVSTNNLTFKLALPVNWRVENQPAPSKKKESFLVLANHQSWVDILVLQKILNRRLPMLKFFLKSSLFWVPVIGQAWWALDFPFMKRYSKRKLAKKPHLAGRDLLITQKACQKFKDLPVSIMAFVEGTRFSPAKKKVQGSPYRHLLKPKAGGAALALAAMSGQIRHIVDVTIAYPQGPATFWAFVCGRVREIRVRVESLPVPSELVGDYLKDPDLKRRFQEWLNQLWEAKDRNLATLCGEKA